jgi:hypothetical protein
VFGSLLVVGVLLASSFETASILAPIPYGKSTLAIEATPARTERGPPTPAEFAALGSVRPSATEVPSWVNLSTSVGAPKYVESPLMAYDPARDAVILTGGAICSHPIQANGCTISFLSNATWQYQSGRWTNITNEVGPSPKGISSGYYQGFMVYDALDGYLVLWDNFGLTNSRVFTSFPQTWILGDSLWTNITSESPQPGHSGWAAYDSANSYVVYLDTIGDTWKFGGGIWTRLGNWTALSGGTSTMAPAFQQVPEMAWDPAADQVILYGGGSALNQTWAFLDGNWSKVNVSGPLPPGNASVPLFYDASLDGLVFYGGTYPATNATAPAFTWLYTNGTWSNVTEELGRALPRPFYWGSVGANDPNDGLYLILDYVNPSDWPDPYLWALADRPVAVLRTSPSLTEENMSVTFDGQAFGGSGLISFHYTGLPPGCAPPTTLVFSCQPIGTGTYVVGLNLTDADGAYGNTTALVRILSPLSVQVDERPWALDVGQGWNLTVNSSNGLPAYAYAYSGLPVGCLGLNASVSCRPSVAGVYAFNVSVTDSLGRQVVWNGSVTVRPDPTVTVALSDAEVETNESETVSWNVTGGSGPYTVTVSGLPTGCPSPATTPELCTAGTPGVYPVTVNAVDALGVANRTTVTVTVVPSLELRAFSVSPPQASVGTSFIFLANVTGGIAPLTFSYSNLPPGCSNQNTSDFGCTPTSSGSWSVGVVVTDDRGAHVSSTALITMTSAPAAPLLAEVGAASAVVILVAVGVVVYLRRRRAREAPPPVPP